MKKSLACLLTCNALFAFADQSTGNIQVTANVPYIVNIPDASVDMNIDNYSESQSETVNNWSIWSNQPGPLVVQVSSQDNANLKNVNGIEDKNFITSLPYTITYFSCGGGAFDLTPRTGSTSATIDYKNANHDVCEQSQGSLTITRLPVVTAPMAGDYVSHVVVTVMQPI